MDLDEVGERANALVATWIVQRYRDVGSSDGLGPSSDDARRHLRGCPDLQIADVEGRDGTYGCDTGCEYARLEADLSCPHGYTDEFFYGEFGGLASIIEDITEAAR